ncbi:hypothetical protein FRC03_004234 [Tulasnella sp. 419]|nr:hypothetical protein FRC03_004234 [Tulasnella sp. 419]
MYRSIALIACLLVAPISNVVAAPAPAPDATVILPTVTVPPKTTTTAAPACATTTSRLIGYMTNTIVADGTDPLLFLNRIVSSIGLPDAYDVLGYRANLSTSRWPANFKYTNTKIGGSLSIDCLYLTVVESAPYSYKPLVWTKNEITTYWRVGSTYASTNGGPLVTSDTSPYGVLKSFLACGTSQKLYLQTGNDLPTDEKCKTVTLSVLVAL